MRYPPALAGLTGLRVLRLSQNDLTGCVPGGLRGVASSDLDDLDMPHCDVLLVGLEIDPGELNQEYDPYVTQYTAVSDADRITVTAMNDPGAAPGYLDHLSRPLPDADPDTAGFQADLELGATFVRVRAMSEDLQAERTYTMLVANGEMFRRYDANGNRVIERESLNPLEQLLGHLIEQYGHRDFDPQQPTEAMLAAEQIFIDVVHSEFQVRRFVTVPGTGVMINVTDWFAKQEAGR